MGEIVVAMPQYENANHIGDIIRRSSIWQEPIISTSGAETLQLVENRDVSIIICSRKFKDMGYEEMISYLPGRVQVILLTKDSALLPFSSNVVKMMMPFKTTDLLGAIKTLEPAFFQKPKTKKPKRSAEEQKAIDDAKQLLIDKNDMTEPDAYRYIQKNSMDFGRTMLESAQMIIMMFQEA